MTRTDFQQIAALRIEEAKILLDQGKWSGAYYLAGYAIECGLKACVARLTNQDDFPDKDFAARCFTHNIEKLVELAGLKAQRDADAPPGSSHADNWLVVKDWTELSRYAQKTQAEAQALYDAITDPTDGVLPWIKLRW